MEGLLLDFLIKWYPSTRKSKRQSMYHCLPSLSSNLSISHVHSLIARLDAGASIGNVRRLQTFNAIFTRALSSLISVRKIADQRARDACTLPRCAAVLARDALFARARGGYVGIVSSTARCARVLVVRCFRESAVFTRSAATCGEVALRRRRGGEGGRCGVQCSH